MKIFTPCTKYEEAEAFGYWKDEKGKLFVDYIKLVDVKRENLVIECKKLFELGEKTVFVLRNEEYSYIINSDYSVILLKNFFGINRHKNFSEKELNKTINKYNGITFFKRPLFKNNYNLIAEKV
jgi:hypothetical protein